MEFGTASRATILGGSFSERRIRGCCEVDGLETSWTGEAWVVRDVLKVAKTGRPWWKLRGILQDVFWRDKLTRNFGDPRSSRISPSIHGPNSTISTHSPAPESQCPHPIPKTRPSLFKAICSGADSAVHNGKFSQLPPAESPEVAVLGGPMSV